MLSRMAFGCLALVACSVAQAQPDIDIFIFNDDGMLTVGGNQDSPGSGRTYIPRFNSFFSVNDPGLNTTPGVLENNAALEWDFLPQISGDLVSTLLYWDGQGETPDFGPPPTEDYSLSLFGRDNARGIASGESELVPGQIFDFANSAGGLHEHRFFFLDNDTDLGNLTNADSGFYLIALRLRSEGRVRSDPFYLAWGTPDSDIDTHRDVVLPWLQAHVDDLVVPGDHNFDGQVDAADYTVWRDGFGDTHSQIDYTQWLENFGAISTLLPSSSAATVFAAAVPEPASVLLLALVGACSASRRRPSR